MLHGIIFSILFLALLVYSISVTLWARQTKRTCTCGAVDGSLHLLDHVLPEAEQLKPRLARRWTDKDFANLLPTPPAFQTADPE